VGEQLWYVAEVQGQWLALLGWSAAAYHLKGRDARIGWNETQRRARLSLLANNARFCLLTPAGAHPNLASYVMGQCLQRLSPDWQEAYGHPILAVESFVDTQLFRGTAYKATGWQALGCTAGFQRVAQDFYQVHDRPKQLLVRELVKHAARTLRARQLPAAWAGYERPVAPHCLLAAEQAEGLWQVLYQQVPESRNVHGLRHKQATVLAIAFAYVLSGGRGGHRGVALFAQDLSPTQRAAFRCWFNRQEHRYEVPTENCIYRVLKAVPVRSFQQALRRDPELAMAELGLAKAHFNAEALADAFDHMKKAAQLAANGKLTPKEAKWIALGQLQLEAIFAAPQERTRKLEEYRRGIDELIAPAMVGGAAGRGVTPRTRCPRIGRGGVASRHGWASGSAVDGGRGTCVRGSAFGESAIGARGV